MNFNNQDSYDHFYLFIFSSQLSVPCVLMSSVSSRGSESEVRGGVSSSSALVLSWVHTAQSHANTLHLYHKEN